MALQHGCTTLAFLVLLVTLCSVGPRPTEAQVTNILEGPFQLDGSTAGGLDDWDEVFASNTTQGILDHTFYAPDVASGNGKLTSDSSYNITNTHIFILTVVCYSCSLHCHICQEFNNFLLFWSWWVKKQTIPSPTITIVEHGIDD